MPLLTPTCPAATIIAGPDPLGPTSICGVLVLDRDKEEQGPDREQEESVSFTTGRDGATVTVACCDAYQQCGIWVAEKDRIRRDGWRLEPDDEIRDRNEVDLLRRAGLDDEARVAQELRHERLREGRPA